MLLSKFLKIVQIEIIVILYYIMISSCNIDLKTEVISKRNRLYPVKSDCNEIEIVHDSDKTSQTNNYYKKRKRNLLPKIKNKLTGFKRKHNCYEKTTCTPFFICRKKITKHVMTFKYPIPPNNSQSLFTEAGISIENLGTKRGKLRNLFFPKLLSTTVGYQFEFDSNNSRNEISESGTAGWEYKEDLNRTNNSITEKNLNNNVKMENFQQVAKKIAVVQKPKVVNVVTTKLNVESILPSIKIDLGLCSGEPKDLMRETTEQFSIKNISLPFSEFNLKSEYQRENPVPTVNFLQKFKLKIFTLNSLKQDTQTVYFNSTLKNRTLFKDEASGYFTGQWSQRSKDSAIGTTNSATFYPYKKFQVKDLFNFKDRPTSKVSDIPAYFVNITKKMENLTSSAVSSKSSSQNISSQNCKPLQTTTVSENEEELQPEIVSENSCECVLDYDTHLNNDISIESNPSEFSITEALNPEVETATLHSFVNLKNLFGRPTKKLNIISNRKTFIYTKRLNRKQQNNNSTQIISTNLNQTYFWKSSTVATLTTIFQPTSAVNESNISTTNGRGFLNLKNFLHLQKKNNSETIPPYLNYKDSEEQYSEWSEYPSTTTKNFESQARPSLNANESLVDMNPEQFYQEFEKSTKPPLRSSSVLVRNQKLHLKNMFSFKKQTLRSQIMNQSLTLSDQTDSQESFQTDPIKLDSFDNSRVEAKEECGSCTPTQRKTRNTFGFNFKKPLNTTQASQGMKLDRFDKHNSQFSLQNSVSEALLNTEDGISTFVARNTLDPNYNCSEMTALEDGIAKKFFKLKSVFTLHKPASSNNTKLCHIFDPGGSTSSSRNVTSQEETVKKELLNSFYTSISTNNYSSEIQKYFTTEAVSTQYSTNPAGWWLFWNQPKVEFDKFFSSKKSSNRFFGTETINLLRWDSTKPQVLQNNTTYPSGLFNSSNLQNTRSRQLFLQNTEGKEAGYSRLNKTPKFTVGRRKSFKKSTSATLNTSANPLSSALKNKQVVHNTVNTSISKFDDGKTKYNHTALNNGSSKNIYSPINMIGLNNKNKVYKPFEKVLNTPQPLGHGNISEFDAKNFSYFIQNLTHKSNNTLWGNSKSINLNSNSTKEHLKLEILNKTDINANNTNSMNDSSFSIMAYVLRPFESLISVFKGKSTQNMTKVGDVNASDIHNGSIPSHLHPQNSSLVILALNNTKTSKEVHESKVGLFDVLGGWFHCIVETYVEPSPHDIHFYLFTRNNIDTPEELFLAEKKDELGHEENVTDIPTPVWEMQYSSESERKKRQTDDEANGFEPLSFATSELESKWFNLLADTKILIHGYIQDYQTDIIVNMKDAYLKKDAFNVVVVDWSTVGDNTCYPSVAEHGLVSVGRLLSRMLDQLVAGGVSLARVHVVGFSLGAHVAGIAGTDTQGLLSRITGLDPALPYVPMDPDICLDAGDAVFVDIIHSAAGYLGQPGPTGHVDFYPNGGSQQPGCDLASLGACSHRRSALYFIESINSEVGFQATPCDTWHDFQTGHCNNSTGAGVLMGEACPTTASGKYFLRTGHKEPFAILAEEHSKVKKSLLLDIFYELV